MRRGFILLSIIFLTFNLTAKSNNKVYFYQPEKVTLSGKLFLKTFPGPPNYESIKKGDRPETGWYLKLDKKIDVLLKKNLPAMGNDEDERNIDHLQLAISYERKEFKGFEKKFPVGSRVKMSGTLFRMITGHHHTRVLLDLEKSERID
jgi:hypothetical protein